MATTSPAAPIQSISNDATAFDDNVLGNYNAPTYHLKFYCNAETTFTQTAQNPYGKLSPANRVVIAESGVTGYNIKSATLESAVAFNASNRNVQTNALRIVISEPSGTSFLDAMYASVSDIGVANWQKAEYGLEISFRGYEEDGSLNSNLCSNFPNNGIWNYRVTILTVEAEVSPAGSEYTIKCHLADDFALTPDCGRLKKNMQISSYSTFRQFLDDFASKLNVQAKVLYAIQPTTGSSAAALYTYAFNTIPFTDAKGNSVDAATFTFANGDDAINSLRAKGFLTGDKTNNIANLKAGDLISDVILTVIGATVQGPLYAIKADGSATDDRGDGGYRPSGVFRVYPAVTNIGYDITTQNYIKSLTYNVKMYRSPKTTLRVAEVQNTANGESMITDVQSYNGLRKRYDYLFTGLNTEVLDFNTRFDFSWNASLPVDLGFTTSMDQVVHHAAYNEQVSPAQIQAQRQQDQLKDATAARQAFLNVTNGSATPIGGQGTGGTSGSTTDAYAEDLVLTRPLNNPFAISALQKGAFLNQHGGTGVVGRYDRRRSIYAAIVSQLCVSNTFATINMRIKGDPYWLGPDPASYYTQGYSSANPSPSNTNSSATTPLSGGALLPDYSYGDYYFALFFKFPYTSDENGAPLMKDDNIFSGLYGPTKIEHVFENGTFTQNITASRATYPTPDQVRKTAAPTTNPTRANPANPSGIGETPASPSNPAGLGAPDTVI